MKTIHVEQGIDEYGNSFISYSENNETPIIINYEYSSIECDNDFDKIRQTIIKILNGQK